MPIIKNILRQGQAKFQGLQNFDVFKDDEFSFAEGAAVSKYFRITNFPSPLPAGNSFFSIEGSEFLKNNVELKTEILDLNNNPIFHFPVFNKTFVLHLFRRETAHIKPTLRIGLKSNLFVFLYPHETPSYDRVGV